MPEPAAPMDSPGLTQKFLRRDRTTPGAAVLRSCGKPGSGITAAPRCMSASKSTPLMGGLKKPSSNHDRAKSGAVLSPPEPGRPVVIRSWSSKNNSTEPSPGEAHRVTMASAIWVAM